MLHQMAVVAVFLFLLISFFIFIDCRDDRLRIYGFGVWFRFRGGLETL